MRHFLFGLQGRVSRASYCLFAAVAFFASLVLFAALYFYGFSAGNIENGGPTPWPSTPLGVLGAVIWFLALFTIFVSALAVSVKRLHDRNKAGWWLVVFVVLPNALYSLSEFWQDSHPENAQPLAFAIALPAIALFVWAFAELACLRGTMGSNRFGSDPLEHRS